MPGAQNDVLSSDGPHVFMRHVVFAADGAMLPTGVPHLFSPLGFLDDSWWHRSYWLIGAKGAARGAAMFANVRWSTKHALADTLANLGAWKVAMLDPLDDVDDTAAYRRFLRASEPLVEVQDLTIHFPVGRSGFWGQNVLHVHAVDDVAFTIGRGETLGLVGESGSGKTTTGRAIQEMP